MSKDAFRKDMYAKIHLCHNSRSAMAPRSEQAGHLQRASSSCMSAEAELDSELTVSPGGEAPM